MPAPEPIQTPLGPVTGTCGLCGVRPAYNFRLACPVCRRALSELTSLTEPVPPEEVN